MIWTLVHCLVLLYDFFINAWNNDLKTVAEGFLDEILLKCQIAFGVRLGKLRNKCVDMCI
jgi:hypothetical protein